MWPFRKKKVYLVKWAYDPYSRPFNELVRAYDEIGAWKKIKRERSITITLINIQEVTK